MAVLSITDQQFNSFTNIIIQKQNI